MPGKGVQFSGTLPNLSPRGLRPVAFPPAMTRVPLALCPFQDEVSVLIMLAFRRGSLFSHS